MKKNLLTAILCTAALSGFAQITITQADIATAGEGVITANDTTSTVSVTAAGANQSWNYSTLQNHTQDTLVFLSPAGQPGASSFPSANLALSDDGSGIFLINSGTGLYVDGFYTDLGTGPMPVNYNPNQLIFGFPSTYNSTFNNTSGFDITMDGSAFGVDSFRIKNTVNRAILADAWGSLIIPGGTYNTLRIKTTDITSDSSWYYMMGMWVSGGGSIDTSYRLSWMANGLDFPILEMDFDPLTNMGSGISYRVASGGTVSVDETIVNEMKCFPNPATSEITIMTLGSEGSIEIFDATGKLAITKSVEFSSTNIQLQSLESGIYFFNFKDAKGNISGRGKFSVVH